ncbi:MAG: hypothetical protein R2809_00070 [Flavobacteriales bacterium]|jgi:hypothetical protein
MEKVQVKQVEGAVDNSTNQVIAGEKTFNNPATFRTVDGQNSPVYIRMEGTFIYWTKNPAILNQEGNMRIGKHPTTGSPAVQMYKGGVWTNDTF